MNSRSGLKVAAAVIVVAMASVAAAQVSAAPPLPALSWATVVNNTDQMPGTSAHFNSYNQPSVNQAGLVVLRARAKGGSGGEPPHGIYTRDVGAGGPIVKVVDRDTAVPAPNNRDPLATFVEYPAFPRIDLASSLYAFRGNSQPVWQDPDNEDETAGTTGVYANVGGTLVTGASKLGGVPGLGFYAVPGLPDTSFEVFPGAPSATGSTIVFKGNYTEGTAARTGIFYRDLAPALYGGTAPVKAIATSGSTPIPGSTTAFGSTSPPSAASGKVAFAGYDNEASPTLGGIYVAPVAERPQLATVVAIGAPVPDWNGRATPGRFNRLGEAVSFDGRFVAFWGAWGSETREVTVTCPTEGNKLRQAACLAQGSPRVMQVPLHQGIFVHDLQTGKTRMAAETGPTFDDFVYWAFTGKVAGSMEGDDGEPAMWRSSAYVALGGGGGANFRVAFKATTPGPVTGVYMAAGPGAGLRSPVTVVDSTTPGRTLDPDAADGSLVAEVGLERDGLRGDWLAISAKLLAPGATEETGMAGIYATRVPWPR